MSLWLRELPYSRRGASAGVEAQPQIGVQGELQSNTC